MSQRILCVNDKIFFVNDDVKLDRKNILYKSKNYIKTKY